MVSNFRFNEASFTQDSPEYELVFAGFGCGTNRYACTPETLCRGAKKRLFGVRENNVLHHLDLVSYQAQHVRSQGPRRFRNFFSARINRDEGYEGLLTKWLELAHPKKKLRAAVKAKQDARGCRYIDTRRYVDYKLKPQEFLAKGKQLRCIGEISDVSAFEHGPIADLEKKVFGEAFHYRCGVAVFIPGPREENLKMAIDCLLDGPERVRYIYFSDDSCIAVKCVDGVFLANMDLSWSDGSMFFPEFEYAIDVLCTDEVRKTQIRSAFKQCQKPIRLINRANRVAGRGKRFEAWMEVKLKEGHYCLPSGFSGTTLMNNFSQILCFTSVVDSLNRRAFRKDQMEEILSRAFKEAGFSAKVLPCEHVEDLQFLKHSWSFGENGWKPYVNLACWLRGYGSIFGHIGSFEGATLQSRCEAFMADIVFSRENWGDHVLSRAFKCAYPPSMRRTSISALRVDDWKKSDLSASSTVPLHTICRRYRVTEEAVLDLCDLIRNEGKFGVHITHPVIGAIMIKDYGYSSEAALPTISPPVTRFVFERKKKTRDWTPFMRMERRNTGDARV
jgi:hypothetical protein